MTERKVRFKDSEEVENFVNAAGQCDFEIDILSDHIYIDAKSFLGMLGLLMNDLKVSYAGDDQKFDSIVQKYAIA